MPKPSSGALSGIRYLTPTQTSPDAGTDIVKVVVVAPVASSLVIEVAALGLAPSCPELGASCQLGSAAQKCSVRLPAQPHAPCVLPVTVTRAVPVFTSTPGIGGVMVPESIPGVGQYGEAASAWAGAPTRASARVNTPMPATPPTGCNRPVLRDSGERTMEEPLIIDAELPRVLIRDNIE
jgi:hypothetical protein